VTFVGFFFDGVAVPMMTKTNTIVAVTITQVRL
jgi:hypothetical protein